MSGLVIRDPQPVKETERSYLTSLIQGTKLHSSTYKMQSGGYTVRAWVYGGWTWAEFCTLATMVMSSMSCD